MRLSRLRHRASGIIRRPVSSASMPPDPLPMIRAAFMLCLLVFAARPAIPDSLTVAVASNFAPAAEEIAALYEAGHDNDVVLVRGSTGKLYAQIMNGAPFDVFLAADAERPRKLEQAGLGIPGSRFTYATGRLVIWSRDPRLRGRDCSDALGDAAFTIAIANPRLAPYGAAARDYLQRAGLWESVGSRLVIGENIAQALQFAVTGGAAVGFVAAAQLAAPVLPESTCTEFVPADLHTPIEQQAVLLTNSDHREAAESFLAFLARDDVRALIRRSGYSLPPAGADR